MTTVYRSDWESIDQRPLPAWFDEAKLGIFVHWGIYSVPAFAPKRSEVDRTGLAYAEWYGWQIMQKHPLYYDFHKRVYGSAFRYEDFAGMWKAEMFDADKWMSLFKDAGAKYFTLVTKHHDAFCLWPSEYSVNWNSFDIGPHRDFVRELYDAADRYGLRRGAYYSLLEWTHPVMRRPDPENADIPRYATEKMIPQLKELVVRYRPELIFADGEWSYPSDKWKSTEFLSWLVNESPVRDTVVFNDRWGSETRGTHGGYYGTEYGEIYDGNAESAALEKLHRHKWEECRSIGASFAFNRNEDIEDYLTDEELTELFVKTVAGGGNLCLNVGPCADGTISPVIQERLRSLGKFTRANGEGIYGSRPAQALLPQGVYATERSGKLYLFAKGVGRGEILSPLIKEGMRAVHLGSGKEVPCLVSGGKAFLEKWPAENGYSCIRIG